MLATHFHSYCIDHFLYGILVNERRRIARRKQAAGMHIMQFLLNGSQHRYMTAMIEPFPEFKYMFLNNV
jgi:hypothetical protein